jgi:SPP1 gp7 family putative phage head morphogenesis protein
MTNLSTPLSLHQKVNKAYQKCNCCDGYHTLSFKRITDLFDIITKQARKIWERENTTLDKDVMTKEFTTLFDGVKEGVDMPSLSYAFPGTKSDTLAKIRNNLVTFVCFKNYHQRAAMIRELTDENGNIRSWSQFRSKVSQLSQEFNDNWLKAEYNATVSSTQSAVQWQDFIAQQRVYPFLEYRTQDDDRVRESHQKLHTVIKPISDDFWNDNYPPNGWNCRCYVLQSKGPANVDTPKLPEDVHPALFRHNSGKDKAIFTEEHPYFTIKPSDKDNVLIARAEFLHEDIFYKKEDGIDVHFSNYGNDKKSKLKLQEHLAAAKLVAPFLDETPRLLPSLLYKEELTCPDFRTKKYIIEYKGIESNKTGFYMMEVIEKRLKEAKKQFNLSLFPRFPRVVILNLKYELDYDKRVLNKLASKINNLKLFLIYEGKITYINELIKKG